MRILICGSRNWKDESAIRILLENMPSNTVVIHGACRGADMIADRLARRMGFKVEVYPADWDRYPKAAGPIRNIRMLTHGKPDRVYAFTDNLSASKGTSHMVEIARKAGVWVGVSNLAMDWYEGMEGRCR